MHTHKTVSPPQRVMIGTDGCSILNLAWKIDWLKALAAYFIDEEKEGKSQFSQIFSSQLLLFASMCCSYPTKSLDLHYNPPKFFPPSFYAIYAIYFLHVKTVFFSNQKHSFCLLFPSLAKEFCEEKGHDITDMLNEVCTVSVITLCGFLHLKASIKICLPISLPFITFSQQGSVCTAGCWLPHSYTQDRCHGNQTWQVYPLIWLRYPAK